MNDKNTFKTIFGLILTCVGFVSAVIMSILTVMYRFQNPDLTEIRVLLERPMYTIGAIISSIFFYIGWFLLK